MNIRLTILFTPATVPGRKGKHPDLYSANPTITTKYR